MRCAFNPKFHVPFESPSRPKLEGGIMPVPNALVQQRDLMQRA